MAITAAQALTLTNQARTNILAAEVQEAASRGLQSISVPFVVTPAQITTIQGLGYTVVTDTKSTVISW